MRHEFLFWAFLSCLIISLPAGGAVEIGMPKTSNTKLNLPDINKEEEVFIEADQLEYDQETKIVTASGKVEIAKGESVLFADNVSYNQGTGVVTANGNVSIVGTSGDAIFTDNFVLSDDLKTGVANYFRTRLSDGSLLAAARARRVNENKLVLHKAVYSPCPICAKNAEEKDSYPQWQIKADKVTVDSLEQKVRYNEAIMEVYGVPVLYTPYFSHPTPNADAKTGFLTPKFNTDSNLGAKITTPYYWSIAPDMDITAQPVITSKEGLVAAAELRQKTIYGDYSFFGSITRPRSFDELASEDENERDWRGHLQGQGRFDLTENWDVGFDGEIASDDTYLRRYDYSSQDLLTSNAYFERIKDRDYSNYQTVYFQGLLEQDDSKTTPFVLPYFQNHFESDKGVIPILGSSTLWTDISGFAVNRELGEESQRFSMIGGINVPLVTPGGQLVEFDGTIRGDQFYIQESDLDSQEHRLIPEASITWHYPLINQLTSSGKLLIEPITKLVVSPNKDYNKDIPNEDSQDVEFSDLNVFDNNRFRGIDRVESGTRIYYGLRGGYYEDDYSISYLLAQNYRFDEARSLTPINSGIEANVSDYVGRVSFSLYNIFDLAYKFRFDKDFAPRRSEIDASLNYGRVKLNLTYFNLDYDFTNPEDNREEINVATQIRFANEWSAILSGARNLADDTNIDASLGILYEGDCTNILTTLRRDFISDRDARSGTSFGIQLGLKNLGNI